MKYKFKRKVSILLLAVAIIIVCLIITIEIVAEPKEQAQEQNETETTLYKEETESISQTTVYVDETVSETIVEVTESEPQVFNGYDFIPLDAELQANIYGLCAEYDIAYGLIISVIKTETEFQWVTGDNGNAVGYMQIWPYWWQDTADSYGLDIYNPVDNVHLGIIILTDALDDNGGDLNKALKQYNSGNPNSESNHYVDKVYKNYEWFEGELQSETT